MSAELDDIIALNFRSGNVEGIPNIQQRRNRAIENAMRVSIPRAIRRYITRVAKDTGAMREGVLQTGEGSDLEQIVVNVERSPSGFRIRQSEVVRAMIDNETKIKWHLRQSPDFNKNFEFGYTNPTTEGTEPINAPDIMTEIATELGKEIPKQMRLEGLEVR